MVTVDPNGVITEADSQQGRDLIGLRVDDIRAYCKALRELAYGKPQKPDMLRVLYRRGWVSAQGSVLAKGDQFRRDFENVSFVRRGS